MTTRFFALLTLLFAALAASGARAADDSPFILVDMGSGAVLAERASTELWYPASLTKLMTAYLTFRAIAAGRLQPDSAVVMSANALEEPPSKMGFPVGTVLTVDNALKMLIVKSANDVAVAIGEAVAGSEAEFVALMNREAQRLGMHQTRFANPNGLPGGNQRTTARDLAVLARAIWVEFPQYHELFGIPAIRSGRQTLGSANLLLERYRGANGMKTGFICASGYNLVATATRGGSTIMAVVLGEHSSLERAEHAASLLNRGFSSWSLLPRTRQTLDGLTRASLRRSPANIRDDVCGPRRQQADNEDADLTDAAPARSALGPRVPVMEPVRVFTGGAVMRRLAANVPLPRAKPDFAQPVIAAVASTPGEETGDVVIQPTFSYADVTPGAPMILRIPPGMPFPRPKP